MEIPQRQEDRAVKRSHKGMTLVEILVVIGIMSLLAGLILPAVLRARAAARDAQCKSNLAQVGKAMRLYLNASGFYFPGFHGYGRLSSSDALFDAQKTSPPKLNPYLGDQAPSRFLVLAFGGVISGPSALNAGGMNWAACGLGLLVKKRYLDDATVLLCPAMGGRLYTVYNGHQYEIRDDIFRQLGGTGKDALEHGNGTGLSVVDLGGGQYTSAILGNYAYRCQSYYMPNGSPGQRYRPLRHVPEPAPGEYVPYIRPRHLAVYMTPFFRTDRQLGDRALLSDAFDYGERGPGGFTPDCGLVHYHHKNFYNVLYGDNHVDQYLDANDEIKYWPVQTSGTYNLTISSGLPDASLTLPDHKSEMGQLAWHVFDVYAGVDVEDKKE